MRARWRERVCPAALFTLQQREMGLPLPVCWDSIYEKVQSRCLCESDSPIVSPGVRLCACIRRVCGCPLASLAQTVQYSLWFSVKKKKKQKKHTGVVNHLKGHEISEGHIFIIWSSPRKWLDIFLQSCAETEASGWDLDGKQKSDNRWLSVSKLDYWPWWKVTAYTVMYWSINVNYFYFLFHATLYLYSTTFQWDILYFQLNS